MKEGNSFARVEIPKAPVPVAVEAQTLTSLKPFFSCLESVTLFFFIVKPVTQNQETKKNCFSYYSLWTRPGDRHKNWAGPHHAAGAVKVT